MKISRLFTWGGKAAMDTALFADTPVETEAMRSFRSEHFPDGGPYPWLDQPDALEQIESKLHQGAITAEEAKQCRYWTENGYIILPQLIEHNVLDEVWDAYEAAISDGTIELRQEKVGEDDPYPGRFLDPHLKVDSFCQILRHPHLFHWLKILMGREPLPFQTITSHKGSQQRAHSDSIHMTTYPLGYLAAAWIAVEDIHPDSGPLVYYPKSHRLPYIFSKDVGIAEADFRERGYLPYQELYEPRIQEEIITHELEAHYFEAKKGDVLIWHANLIHGGSLRRNLSLSRRAVVCHFFVKGAFAYHDLSSSRTKPFEGTCLLQT